jgi:hypothetical protein
MSKLIQDDFGNIIQAFNLSGAIPRGLSLVVGAAQQTAALGQVTNQSKKCIVLIMCEAATWVLAGDNPTAAVNPATCTLLAPGIPYYFAVSRGQKISAFLNTGEPDSVISITEFN